MSGSIYLKLKDAEIYLTLTVVALVFIGFGIAEICKFVRSKWRKKKK